MSIINYFILPTVIIIWYYNIIRPASVHSSVHSTHIVQKTIKNLVTDV